MYGTVTFMRHLMLIARSLLFYIFLVIWTASWPILLFPAAIFSRHVPYFVSYWWSKGILLGLRLICNLHIKCEGIENIPPKPFIVASKHQSAIETVFLSQYFYQSVFVLKREILWIPIYGWYVWTAGMAYIDRKAGVKALRKIASVFSTALNQGRVVVIFVEGSRSRPFTSIPYKPGIAFVHATAPDVPIVPVALNSGLFLPKGGWRIHPGVIRIRFLPPIMGKFSRQDLLTKLQEAIEPATNELCS